MPVVLLRIAGLVIILPVFLIFSVALKNQFLDWDDQSFILDNLMIQSLSLENVKIMASSLHRGAWHPLTWFSHAIDYHFFKHNPAGHHFTNVLLHSLNTLWVFLLFARLAGLKTGITPGVIVGGMIAAILFGIHPLRVESVVWVSERKDVLCAFFILATYNAYLSYVAADAPKIRRRWYGVMLFMAILALMSKSMAVTLPVVMLILDIYPLQRWQNKRQGLKLIVEKIPFFTLSLMVGGATLVSLRTSGRLISTVSVDLTDRVLNASTSLLFYIEKTLWPTHLIPIYPLSKSASMESVWSVLPLITVLAVTMCFMWMLKNRKYLLPITWFYYLFTVAPVLGIIQAGSHARADRYTYLPTLGFYFLLGLGVVRLWNYSPSTLPLPAKSIRAVIVLACIVVTLALGCLTVRQIGVWKNSETFWGYVGDSLPNRYALADFQVGKYFSEQGREQDAIGKYKQALQNDPDYIAALNALGYIYDGKGMYQEAEKYYRRAVDAHPEHASIHLVHNSLALIYIKTNQLEKAHAELQESLRLNLSDAETRGILGMLYQTLGRFSEAEQAYKSAIALNFNNPTAHLNLGVLYKEMDLLDKAMIEFNRDIYPEQFRDAIQKLRSEINAALKPGLNH